MPRLLDQVREVIRMEHYSIRTEYLVDSIRRDICFDDKRHPDEMDEDEIRSLISDLASKKSALALTQTVTKNSPLDSQGRAKGGFKFQVQL